MSDAMSTQSDRARAALTALAEAVGDEFDMDAIGTKLAHAMVEAGDVLASPPAADPRVAEAVKALDGLLTEAKESAGDIFHDTWNPDAHVELTLTIAELRGLTELRAILTAQAGDAN
jgi:hypothetical protein